MGKMNIGLFLLALAASRPANAQNTEATIRLVFDHELTQGKCYDALRQLTQIGPRVTGSPGAAQAVKWGATYMKSLSFDTVFLQPVMVPRWTRGEPEEARVMVGKKSLEVNVCALGGSVGTGPGGTKAHVVEVYSLDTLASLGASKLSGKIVFFNRPMNARVIDTFSAYGGAVDQRVQGASEAAKYGAVGVVIRSMASNIDDFPHTGMMKYENDRKIPAVAISTADAEMLSSKLREDANLEFYFRTTCETLPDVLSHNVVGQITGKRAPLEFIVVGGHLDAWDLGDGAHDDGAGCVQAMDALNTLKAIGYQPAHSLRVVFFMNEENGGRGGNKYAEMALANGEKHLAAIESDRGGFVPRGFTMTADQIITSKVRSWEPLFAPYGLHDFDQAGGGADIEPLQKLGVPVMELLPDSQRYFNYHHTSEDKFEYVDPRELELGAASMATMVYLLDSYFSD